MTTITIDPDRSTSTSPSVWPAGTVHTDAALVLPADAEVAIDRAIPPLTDPEQAYFWTADWQAAEHTADAELRAGLAPTFTSINDGMRWLLSGEA